MFFKGYSFVPINNYGGLVLEGKSVAEMYIKSINEMEKNLQLIQACIDDMAQDIATAKASILNSHTHHSANQKERAKHSLRSIK